MGQKTTPTFTGVGLVDLNACMKGCLSSKEVWTLCTFIVGSSNGTGGIFNFLFRITKPLGGGKKHDGNPQYYTWITIGQGGVVYAIHWKQHFLERASERFIAPDRRQSGDHRIHGLQIGGWIGDTSACD